MSENPKEPPLKLGESIAGTGLLTLLFASLLFSNPALAFKSILRQANFKGAKLLGASFFHADLTGAHLSDADLRGADFALANVTKVFKRENISHQNLMSMDPTDSQAEMLYPHSVQCIGTHGSTSATPPLKFLVH
ncbi:hypothetical protein SAY87_027646 [Trapa incisa]|uniref:Pentapeptide repeat-containing protein n=1 Tax=Trapa incisa TaxID=236973 RepID=A0AAN7PIE3_9MYRT|nr:hypothetical protein SAY87_027646 [Trapa incisa]